MPYTRRDFLKTGAFLVSMGVTAPAFLTRTAELVEAQINALGPLNRRILVIVQLSGGNDGINTVIPYADPAYATNRPVLKITSTDPASGAPYVLPFDNLPGWGLHSGLSRLMDRYKKNQLAIIHNVGYPNPNRSHFRSMDIWHTAQPSKIGNDGWIGRYLDACCNGTGATSTSAAIEVDSWSLGSTLPLAMWTTHVVVPTINTVASFTFQTDGEYPDDRLNKLDAFKQIYAEQASPRVYDAFVRQVGQDAMTTSEVLATVAKSYTPTVTFPTNNSFAQSMKTVAQLVVADLNTRLFYVTQGGYDTHAAQANTHATLMQRLAEGIDLFLQEMENQGRLDDVVLLCFSEFGRRVKENATAGTDHGTVAPMFAIGGPVKGGFYGTPPNFADLANGDFKFVPNVSTDFRSVYSTAIGPFLGGNPNTVLEGTYAPVPFI